MEKTYLGDGAFVAPDVGGIVWLTTENGVETTNRICLEPETLATLLGWLSQNSDVFKNWAAKHVMVHLAHLPRPEVMEFARDMERKLKENDHKGGWEDADYAYLWERLGEEKEEVGRLFVEPGPNPHKYCIGSLDLMPDETLKSLISELADVANYAMMIADQFRNRLKLREENERTRVDAHPAGE